MTNLIFKTGKQVAFAKSNGINPPALSRGLAKNGWRLAYVDGELCVLSDSSIKCVVISTDELERVPTKSELEK